MKLDKNNFALRIIDINAGWMLVEYEINGKTYTFDISSVIGDPFECLLEVAYYFNGSNHDPLEEEWTGYGKHYSYFRYFDDNGNEFYLDDLPPEEEKVYWEEHHSIAEK